MSTDTEEKDRAIAAQLAEEHGSIVLASALLVRLDADGQGELAGAVLSLLAGNLSGFVSPTPPKHGARTEAADK